MVKIIFTVLMFLALQFSLLASCDSLTVTQLTVINATCYGSNNGVIIVTSSGGVGPVKYALSSGGGFQFSDTFKHLQAIYYAVYIRDSAGCSITVDTQVQQPAIITLDASELDVATVGGTSGAAWIDSISGGTPPYGCYLWSNGQTGDTIVNLAAGTYCVTVCDINNCKSTICTNVLQPSCIGYGVSVLTVPDSTAGAANGIAWAQPLSGTPQSYTWSNGATTDTLTALAAGSYCVTVIDQNGCSASGCGTVRPPAVYHHLLDSINIWHYAYYFCAIAPPPVNNNGRSQPACGDPTARGIVWTGDDSVFNNTTYRQLNVMNIYSEGGVNSAPCYLGLILEDTLSGKVYFIKDSSTSQILLYDFGMQVGQTINVAFIDSSIYYQDQNGDYLHTGTYTLDSITTTNIEVGLRKKYNLSCHTGYGAMNWIESVGSLADIIYPDILMWPSCSPDYKVVCFEHNNHVYFDSLAYYWATNPGFNCSSTVIDSCDFTGVCGGINEVRSLSSFSVYPVPATGDVTLRLDVAVDDNFDITVKDMECRDTGVHLPIGNLSPGTYSRQLAINGLSPGIYLIECLTGNGAIYNKVVVAR